MESTGIVEITGDVDFRPLLPMIRSEWPEGFGGKNDEELIALMEGSLQPGVDVVHQLYLDGRLAGFSRYKPWKQEESDPPGAHTLDIAVAEEFRGRGLGRLLMENMMEDCRKRGYSRLLSRSLRNNPVSLALHRNMGFSVFLETDDSVVWEAAL